MALTDFHALFFSALFLVKYSKKSAKTYQHFLRILSHAYDEIRGSMGFLWVPSSSLGEVLERTSHPSSESSLAYPQLSGVILQILRFLRGATQHANSYEEAVHLTLQGINISHLGKRKIIFKHALVSGICQFPGG